MKEHDIFGGIRRGVDLHLMRSDTADGRVEVHRCCDIRAFKGDGVGFTFAPGSFVDITFIGTFDPLKNRFVHGGAGNGVPLC